MCTFLFALKAHPEYPLVIAANRDEYYARPTAPAAFWDRTPHVLAGRDLKAGGTWLGITRSGRWAAITNVRKPRSNSPTKTLQSTQSRGWLVRDYLESDDPPETYLATVAGSGHLYDGFNLIAGQLGEAWYLSNAKQQSGQIQPIEPGVHGVSNASLNTPWPKVENGREVLANAMASATPESPIDSNAMLDALADSRRSPDELLPDTGVGLELERVLSPLFIATPHYGTCSSTVISVRQSGIVTFVERTTNPAVAARSELAYNFVIAE